jgi:hypothetical protein
MHPLLADSAWPEARISARCAVRQRFAAGAASRKVHQAAVIDRGADFRAGIEHIANFVRQHGRRYISILDGKSAPKSATLLHILNRLQIEAAHLLQQPDWNIAQVQAAHGVTARVIGNFVRIGRADILDAQLAHEKLGKLVDPRQERFNLRDQLRIAIHLGGFHIVVAHHGDAGGRRNHYRLRRPDRRAQNGG